MVEYLNEENSSEFEKIFRKSLKKHKFKDLRNTDTEKCILLFKEGNNYVGFLEGYISDNIVTESQCGHIIALYVIPVYRKEGKAHALVLEFENWLKSKNVTDIITGMLVKNKKANEFFEKVAFNTVGTCVLMTKSIE